jgi:hypothetical protein
VTFPKGVILTEKVPLLALKAQVFFAPRIAKYFEPISVGKPWPATSRVGDDVSQELLSNLVFEGIHQAAA